MPASAQAACTFRGGFARYAVDRKWLVPHFEKMLYDNAQLIGLLTELWRVRRRPAYAQRVRQTIGWLIREMSLPDGAFAVLSLELALDGVPWLGAAPAFVGRN